MEQQYSTIEEALEELRAGRIIITIDDPDRENEGDMICAAQFATTENVNFMATHAKGLICTPMSAELAARLHSLSFTQSVIFSGSPSRKRLQRYRLFPFLQLLPHTFLQYFFRILSNSLIFFML